MPARESDFCEKKDRAAWSEHFWKLSSAKFAPRLRARSIWKSKSLKTDGLGTFLEVQSDFRVAGAGISTRCKIRGRRRGSSGLQKRRRGGFEEGLKRCVSRGTRKDFVHCDVDV